jgi:hypothetical protein
MKKKTVVVTTLNMAATLLAAVAILCACGTGATTVQKAGLSAAGLAALQAEDANALVLASGKVIFTENGSNTEYSYADLGFAAAEGQETDEAVTAGTSVVQCDTDVLSGVLEDMNTGRSAGTDATFVKTEDGIAVQEGTSGNLLDTEALSEYLLLAFSDGTVPEELSVALEDFYTSGDVISAEKLQETLDSTLNTSVTYEDGEVISLSDYAAYLDTDGASVFLTADGEQLAELSGRLQEDLEALFSGSCPDIENGFYASDGDVVVISGGTWEKPVTATLDVEAEAAHVLERFAGQESETDRLPVYAQDTGIGNTYVEVSLSDQHVWHYIDGMLCCETDCTTGNVSDGHSTPVGFYTIVEMVDGKYLWPKGVTEGIWVDKWMRTTWTGYGLHDAQWRTDGEFGGDNYLENGSHGCINLPTEYAYHLYDNVYLGMPVIIY